MSERASDAQLRLLFRRFDERGLTERDDRIAFMAQVLAGDVSSSKELISQKVGRVIDSLERDRLVAHPRQFFEAAATLKAKKKTALLDAPASWPRGAPPTRRCCASLREFRRSRRRRWAGGPRGSTSPPRPASSIGFRSTSCCP